GQMVTVGTPGRITLPPARDAGAATLEAEVTAPAAMKTRLLLGSSGELRVTLNGKPVYTGRPGADQPDQAAADVELQAGVNRLVIETKHKGPKAAVYARF